MPTLDPVTNQPLPDSAILRILFISPTIHIYQIPPITSSSGFSASSWTHATAPTAQHIFTARLRILETSLGPSTPLKVSILLEDPSSGALFAAAPYTSPAVVQQANDSSRFFAVRVVGDGGMKATLGIGFEDRSLALDFGIALGEARKVLGMEKSATSGKKLKFVDEKRDFSLKEGEKIHVNLPIKGRRGLNDETSEPDNGAALFSIAPPPPPASAAGGKMQQADVVDTHGKTAQELGFDDGEFGEFQ